MQMAPVPGVVDSCDNLQLVGLQLLQFLLDVVGVAIPQELPQDVDLLVKHIPMQLALILFLEVLEHLLPDVRVPTLDHASHCIQIHSGAGKQLAVCRFLLLLFLQPRNRDPPVLQTHRDKLIGEYVQPRDPSSFFRAWSASDQFVHIFHVPVELPVVPPLHSFGNRRHALVEALGEPILSGEILYEARQHGADGLPQSRRCTFRLDVDILARLAECGLRFVCRQHFLEFFHVLARRAHRELLWLGSASARGTSNLLQTR
mmetsp:Transcript_95284/g.211850  ORF Transcript_95284/g.211850 Transcript_95284/m.211850 type:complete len:259 (-) Transcript_95284:142-918(-)